MTTMDAICCQTLRHLLTGLILMPFVAVAQTKPAPNAPHLIANQAQARESVLPLRNLLIEVRQQGGERSQRSSVDAQGRVILQPGRSGGEVAVGIEQTRAAQDRQLSQQALVLNGKSVGFSLGQTAPLRVVQVLAFNGNLHFVPSTILIERNSGFSARPLWYGDDVAEVEISTMRTQGTQSSLGTRHSSASTTLQVQMNEWITIAQGEESQTNTASGMLSQSGERAQSNFRVEMRVTVK
jgi:hypothetical protein